MDNFLQANKQTWTKAELDDYLRAQIAEGDRQLLKEGAERAEQQLAQTKKELEKVDQELKKADQELKKADQELKKAAKEIEIFTKENLEIKDSMKQMQQQIDELKKLLGK